MSQLAQFLLLSVALGCLAGCEDEGETTNAVGSDSVGVRVVRSSAPDWGTSTKWSIGRVATIDLTRSGTGPAHEFFVVGDAIRLSDGRLVVSDIGSSQIRFYTPDGRFIRAAGRSGDGPGDFRTVRALSPVGADSVAAHDVFLNRITVMDRDGAVGTITTLRTDFKSVRQLRAFGDSTFLGLGEPFLSTAPEGLYRVEYAVVRISREGVVSDTVTWIRGRQGYATASVDGPVPFRRDGHLAIQGQAFVTGSADSLMYDRYVAPARHVQRALVTGYDLALSAAQVDSVRATLYPSGGPPPPRAVVDFIEEVEIPAVRPAYSKLLIDAAGYVWAAQHHGTPRAESEAVWEIFSPEGEWLGQIRAPAGFEVLQIGEDYIVGVRRDEADVEHVEVRALHRSLVPALPGSR